MKPLVSAVIPTFNYGRFVVRAVNSVLTQTYGRVECIVVDDGSTDDTGEVLASFGDRVTVLHQPNKGLSSARNAGILGAAGEFVAFLDADDWWHARKIETQVAYLAAHPEVGCIGCGLEHVYPDGTVERMAGRRNDLGSVDTFRGVALRRVWIRGSGSGAMVRRSVLDRVGPFDEDLTAAEDWDMWLRLAAVTRLDNVPDVLVSITRHGTGVFRNVRTMEMNQWRVYHKADTIWPGVLSRIDRRLMRALILTDAARESTADRTVSLSYYFRAFNTWPFDYARARGAVSSLVKYLIDSVESRRYRANPPSHIPPAVQK